jgi:methyltransferase family protein
MLSLDGGYVLSDHLIELEQTLGPFPKCLRGGTALEVGCGVSPYAKAIEEAGWLYDAMDASPWAVEWMMKHGHQRTFLGDWESWNPKFQRGLILAAHVIEHLLDAPAGLWKMVQLLKPPNGELWLVVADNTDRCDPDMKWFFTRKTLTALIEKIGLKIDRLTDHVHKDGRKSIYLKARKL